METLLGSDSLRASTARGPSSQSMQVDDALARDFGTGAPNLVVTVSGRAPCGIGQLRRRTAQLPHPASDCVARQSPGRAAATSPACR